MVDRLSSEFVDFFNLILYPGGFSMQIGSVDAIHFGDKEIEIIHKDKIVNKI